MIRILCFCMLVMSTSCFALDTRGLSREQISQLELEAAKMKVVQPGDDVKNISAVVREEAEQWGKLGTNIGSAMVSAAKEVGVATAEFSETNLGKIVTFIVVYKVIGQDLLGIVIGSFILLTFIPTGFWIIFGKVLRNVEYEEKPWLWNLTTRRVATSITTSDDAVIGKIVCGLLVIIIGLVVGGNCIF